MKKRLISIIVPVYNEEPNINWLYEMLQEKLPKRPDYEFETIFVDDGSEDKSLEVIKDLRKKYAHSVRYVSFSRNFGKESAVSAGMHESAGAAAIVIDADGQHPIELIDTFITKWEAGSDIVIGLRESNQKEGFVKKFGSKMFYSLLSLINGRNSVMPGSTDFRLIDRKVIDEYNKLTERNRLTRNLIDWLGFKRAVVPFAANERHAGTAAYSVRKLVKLALDGIVAHSTRPLKVVSLLGFIISSFSVIGTLFLVVEKYFLNDPLGLAVSGVAILALFLSFLVGVVLICQGLLALYLESVYYETQNRPLYVIGERSE